MTRFARLTIVAWWAVAELTLPGCGSLIVTQRSVESLETQRGFSWETHDRSEFVLYVEPDSDASRDIDEIDAGARRAKDQVLAYLEEPAYEPTVSIFLVRSRDRMKDLIGRRSNAMAYHDSNVLCLVWSDTLRGGTTHELLHVVAMNLWGVPERWVNEGMAVDAAGPWRGDDVHAVCKALAARGERPSLDELTKRFNRIPPIVSYPVAGSLVRYLRETYGLETVRAVWDSGRRALPAATGTDVNTLEAAWLAVVDTADDVDLDDVR